MADDVKFGTLLGDYRARCGWSQEELAKKVGVSRNAIVLWERHERGRQTNTHPRSREVVLRLADELLLSKEERKGFLEAAGMSIEHWPAEYWNVPYQHNPYFVGRETILQSLRQRLIPGEKATALTQSISGLGGIGKTQTAVEYAHRYGEQYEAVLWIQADSQEVAMVGLLRLATEVLGLPEQQEAEQQIAAVMRWLQKRHNWLLIFDNVEDPQAILSTFVPSKHQGSVLITTRRRDAGTLAHNEVLPLLSEDEAILFLLRRAGRIAKSASVTDATSTDFFLARDLCQFLGHLSLALDQAGAYIAENGCSLQRYRELYEHSRPKLLDRRGSRDHPDSVVMTFWLSWEQIQQRNALAGKALQFCAFLATDQIPEPLVQAGIMFSETEKAPEDVELDEALGLLYRYSLIERAGPSLSLHRLVLDVTQEVLSEEEQQQWMRRAIRVVNAFFPSGEHGTWLQCELLLPHALTCAKWISVLGQKKSEDARLLGASGLYLYERGQYREAEPLLKHALLIQEEQLEVSFTDVTNSLNNLAALYRAQGRYGEAEPLLKHALLIREEQLGVSHPHTASSLNNLAALYRIQGRYGEAELLYQRALDITEGQLGASHPQTAASLNNLAAVYESQGRYGEAEPLYRRALRIAEKQLGASHPQTAASLNNLAGLYESQGRYEEAEPLLKHALLIREEQLGASHPLLVTNLNNLATLYQSQGHYEEAEPLLKRALDIAEGQLGASHPQTAISLNNLAALYQVQGRYGEAEPLLKQALLIREEQLGASHPDKAASLNSLATLYESQGRYEEAEPLYQHALLIREEQLGASHPQTAVSLNNLAALYRVQGRYGEAEPLLKRALDIAEGQLGASHPQTAASLNNLAAVYESQGRYGEAEPLYLRALHIREEQLGASHPDTAGSLNKLALLYYYQGHYGEAEPLLKRALLIAEEQLGASHPQIAGSLSNLAELYRRQGRYGEAEPLYRRAVKVALTSLGPEHPQTQQILRNLLALLSDLYTNGDMVALFQLLAQKEQDGNTDGEVSHE